MSLVSLYMRFPQRAKAVLPKEDRELRQIATLTCPPFQASGALMKQASLATGLKRRQLNDQIIESTWEHRISIWSNEDSICKKLIGHHDHHLFTSTIATTCEKRHET